MAKGYDGHTDERGGNLPTPDNAPKSVSHDTVDVDRDGAALTALGRRCADGSASGFSDGAPGYVPPASWDNKTGHPVPQSQRAGAGPRTHGQ